MYRTINEFTSNWQHESTSTQKLLYTLTDASLKQKVTDEDRTIARLSWHITTSLHEMISRTGLSFKAAEHDSVIPTTARQIAEGYHQASESMIKAIKDNWTDETLTVVNDMYGEQWANGLTLAILVSHQIHHRGQLTVLMRQAGLKVPGIYGPSREEWASFGMEPPAT